MVFYLTAYELALEYNGLRRYILELKRIDLKEIFTVNVEVRTVENILDFACT